VAYRHRVEEKSAASTTSNVLARADDPGRERRNLDLERAAAHSDIELWSRLCNARTAERALEELYDRYAPLVFGLSMRILGDRQVAEDVTQEVFLALFEGRSYDDTRGSFRTYLTLFTRSRAIDRLRRQQRGNLTRDRIQVEASEVSRDAGPSPLEHASIRENARAVSDAIAMLNERQRAAIDLAYFRGMSQSEVANELELPLGTVKGLIRSALQSMRNTLGHWVG